MNTLNRMTAICSRSVYLVFFLVALGACTKKDAETTPPASSDANKNEATTKAGSAKGIGPVTEVKIEGLNVELATKGKAIFEAKCSACHKVEERYVGPALKDVTKRRTPEWIMNMILNPVEMTQKDPIAQELLGEFLTQMTFQNVSQDEARGMLEYFRQIDGAK
ncbi:MAG: cytochrome c [Bdellovibrionaceae bacterium]|nr:cytochrome c [Pseudobdellovibrionaceae bacterium]